MTKPHHIIAVAVGVILALVVIVSSIGIVSSIVIRELIKRNSVDCSTTVTVDFAEDVNVVAGLEVRRVGDTFGRVEEVEVLDDGRRRACLMIESGSSLNDYLGIFYVAQHNGDPAFITIEVLDGEEVLAASGSPKSNFVGRIPDEELLRYIRSRQIDPRY